MLTRCSQKLQHRSSSWRALAIGVLLPALLCGCSQLGSLRSRGVADPLPTANYSTVPQDAAELGQSENRYQQHIGDQASSTVPPSSVVTASATDAVPANYGASNGAGNPVAFTASTYQEGVSPVSCELPTEHYGCQTGACVACQACGEQPTGFPFHDYQEYVCDGGDDKAQVVIRDDWTAIGVEPTDTVIYYETQGGQVCVKPSNRVCIYAPRFGAVRQVSGANLASGAIGTNKIYSPITPGRLDETNLASSVSQPLAPHGEDQVNLIDAFQEEALGTPIQSVVPLRRMSEARVPWSAESLLTIGRITDQEIAVHEKIIQNAHAWTNVDAIKVIVDGQQVALQGSAIGAQDVHVYDMPDKCAVRIFKTASHSFANSGDIVSFTLRFDNSGPNPVENIVIMDSLSPRLEYIEGSQQCSVDVRFTDGPNEVGSKVLKWELVNPLKPSDGGAISFDCRVR